MASAKLRFKQREVARAIRAAARSGVPTQRVEIDRDGRISVILGSPKEQGLDQQDANEWDSAV